MTFFYNKVNLGMIVFTKVSSEKDQYHVPVQRSSTTGLRPAALLKKDSGTSFGFCEISKNTFIHRTPLVAASVKVKIGSLYPNTITSDRNYRWCLVLRGVFRTVSETSSNNT